MGKSKTTELIVGLRKRTSGPSTGYIAIKPLANGRNVLKDPYEVATEFLMDDPDEAIGDLYKDELEKYMK